MEEPDLTELAMPEGRRAVVGNAFAALMKAFRKAAGCDPDYQFRNWLFDIAWPVELSSYTREDAAKGLEFMADVFTKAAKEIRENVSANQYVHAARAERDMEDAFK